MNKYCPVCSEEIAQRDAGLIRPILFWYCSKCQCEVHHPLDCKPHTMTHSGEEPQKQGEDNGEDSGYFWGYGFD